MQDSILIVDCFDKEHIIKIDSILDFISHQTFKNSPITIIKLKETLENGIHKDYRTYELEESVRLRYSKIYDTLHKED